MGDEPHEFSILTPYSIAVVQAVSGTLAPGDNIVFIEGGEIAWSKLEVNPAGMLEGPEPW